jgi:hypothetical protein
LKRKKKKKLEARKNFSVRREVFRKVTREKFSLTASSASSFEDEDDGLNFQLELGTSSRFDVWCESVGLSVSEKVRVNEHEEWFNSFTSS